MSGTYRPTGAIIATVWAAVNGGLHVLGAVGIGVLGGTSTLLSPSDATMLMFVSFLTGVAGMAMFALSVGLYQVRPWARTIGILLFSTLGILNVVSLIGSLLALQPLALADIVSMTWVVLTVFVPLCINVAVLILLVINHDAFADGTRAEISAGTRSETGSSS